MRLVATTALLLALLHGRAEACLCGRGGLPCEAFYAADAVFVGRVEAIDSQNTGSFGSVRVPFRIIEAFRGVSTTQVELTIGTTSCDFNFVVGRRYIVYARRLPGGETLTTSKCSRTGELSEAADDLEFARAQTTGAPTGGTIL